MTTTKTRSESCGWTIGYSLDAAPAPLTQRLLFEGWHRNGYKAVNNKDGYGEIRVGAPADVVVLDCDAMAFGIIDGMADPLDVALTRATSRDVKNLVVAGREIVRDGKLLSIDLDAIEREVAKMARSEGERMRKPRPIVQRSQGVLSDYHSR